MNTTDLLDEIVERLADAIAARLADRLPKPNAVASAPTTVPVQYLNTAQAAKLLGLSPATLEVWRTKGKGPATTRVGTRVRYSRAGLEAWLASNTRGRP